MKYGSVCSGIEAASVAWWPLGFKPSWFSEIEPFPCAVLEHHWPHVPNYGDMTKFKDWENGTIDIDILVGGTPCQSFSIAGLRKGLDDPRGNLMLTYLAIAEKYQPEWLVFENVPGVLSSNKGRDFGTFLGSLAQLGYGFAYRILDAQYFGVPQRRRRVFVVANLRDWRRATAVLFEPESVRGNNQASKSQREEIAKTLRTRLGNSNDAGKDDYIVVNGRQDPCVSSAVALASGKQVSGSLLAHCLTTSCGTKLDFETDTFVINDDKNHEHIVSNLAVRRLTPLECERLQGFPDNHTLIPWRNKPASECPDTPRFKAIGNSIAVPVMRWIGERIKLVHENNNESCT